MNSSNSSTSTRVSAETKAQINNLIKNPPEIDAAFAQAKSVGLESLDLFSSLVELIIEADHKKKSRAKLLSGIAGKNWIAPPDLVAIENARLSGDIGPRYAWCLLSVSNAGLTQAAQEPLKSGIGLLRCFLLHPVTHAGDNLIDP